MKPFLFCCMLVLVSACGSEVNKTDTWLIEYEKMLQTVVNLTGDERVILMKQIISKEEELQVLLKQMSTQQQMNFLSRYYDVRIRYNNAVFVE